MVEKDLIIDNFSGIGVDLNEDALEKCEYSHSFLLPNV